MVGRDELEAEITREEQRLASLRADVEAAVVRLAELRKQLATESLVRTASSAKSAAANAKAPVTNSAKVALFRSLFRGREDVFPRRW
jgi:hypothetical protein